MTITALTDYDRLEATGLWRADAEAQRLNVIVSVGEASLTLYDLKDSALAHWSLAAVERCNPGQRPALYAPAPESDEKLEIEDDEMIAAIEKVRTVVEKNRPHQGRLRLAVMVGGLAAVTALSVFWLPDALIRHAVSVVPPVARTAIGAQLLSEIEHLSGAACVSAGGQDALDKLGERLFGPGAARLVVLPDGIATTAHVPGRTILVNRKLVEDFESPEPVAGYLLAEAARAAALDPLKRFLDQAGPMAAFRLLTTGHLPPDTFRSHAEDLTTTPPSPVPDADLLRRFTSADVSSRPYAIAVDISGETVLPLIEADPYPAGTPEPVLSDGDWLRLQAICEE